MAAVVPTSFTGDSPIASRRRFNRPLSSMMDFNAVMRRSEFIHIGSITIITMVRCTRAPVREML